MVLGSASVALHHKLCHTLGGRFDMPHAETHTANLPHAIAYNAAAAPDAMVRASPATGGRQPPAALYELASKLGAELSLAKLGMPEEGVEIPPKHATKHTPPTPPPGSAAGTRPVHARR